MSENKRLMGILRQYSDLIEKTREDCLIPADKFYGRTAVALADVQRNNLDIIKKTNKKLENIFKEEMDHG